MITEKLKAMRYEKMMDFSDKRLIAMKGAKNITETDTIVHYSSGFDAKDNEGKYVYLYMEYFHYKTSETTTPILMLFLYEVTHDGTKFNIEKKASFEKEVSFEALIHEPYQMFVKKLMVNADIKTSEEAFMFILFEKQLCQYHKEIIEKLCN